MAERAERVEARGLRSQLLRFALVGGFSAIVDYGLLMLLMHAGLGHNVAKMLSFVAGTATAYALNRRFTFTSEGSAKKFAATMALYAVTFVVQVGLFAWLFPTLRGAGLSEAWSGTVGFVVAQGVATVVNFVVQRTVIFRT